MFLLVAAVIGSLLECASVGIFQPFVELFMDQFIRIPTWNISGIFGISGLSEAL